MITEFFRRYWFAWTGALRRPSDLERDVTFDLDAWKRGQVHRNKRPALMLHGQIVRAGRIPSRVEMRVLGELLRTIPDGDEGTAAAIEYFCGLLDFPSGAILDLGPADRVRALELLATQVTAALDLLDPPRRWWQRRQPLAAAPALPEPTPTPRSPRGTAPEPW